MEKPLQNTPTWAPVFMTASLLWVTGAEAHQVYFDCGAVVDVVDEQGLVLSPGFPYNYSSGTHCVWQFFVPVGYRLTMEMFDFDVFESPESLDLYFPTPEGIPEENNDETVSTPRGSIKDNVASPKGSSNQTQVSTTNASRGDNQGLSVMTSKKDDGRQVVVQEQSTKMEMTKISNSAKRSTELLSAPPPPPPLTQGVLSQALKGNTREENSISVQAYRGDADPDEKFVQSKLDDKGNATPTPETATGANESEADSQPPLMEACPHDVLYISDLITFSSRFCGSNKPTGRKLVFGSSEEMVEVIMELITTTHWGRGFVLLFQYRNETDPDDAHFPQPTSSRTDALLAAMSGAAFFVIILTGALCIIFRPKICVKGANACSSNSPEGGIQTSGVDASELQLVVPNQPGLDVTSDNDNNNHSLIPAQTGPSVSGGVDISHDVELELSSNGMTELELGADEVFVISPGPAPSHPIFSPVLKDRFLRKSETSPGPVCDWLAAAAGGRGGKESAPSRSRAWSVRTFQDFLPPLPQLHRKWCSWNSTSPFTKLVDSVGASNAQASASSVSDCRKARGRKDHSDAHLEDAMMENHHSDYYPPSQPSQRSHRLNSTSNLRRARFVAPCFGLLTSSPEGPRSPTGPLVSSPHPHDGALHVTNGSHTMEQGKARDFPSEGEHGLVPVFPISEEEDRQPLVLTEHLGQCAERDPYTQNMQESRSPGGQRAPFTVNGASFSQQCVPSEWSPWGSQHPEDTCGDPSESQAQNADQAESHCLYSKATRIPSCSMNPIATGPPCGVLGEQV
ncbi:uncharacterized protein LOC136712320 [Amia ocellicauda]|uniref:uncharacterized protein LOC136712320 n=1 Tax=Amia ocellicauda TaxID=2972642 RepID=UPI003464AC8B